FRAAQPWRLEVRLDAEWLIVAIRTERRRRAMPIVHERRESSEPVQPSVRERWSGDEGRSCMSCDQPCSQARSPSVGIVGGRRSWLLDGVWPEYAAYLRVHAGAGDRSLIPIDGQLLHTPRYAWPHVGGGATISFPTQTLIRS